MFAFALTILVAKELEKDSALKTAEADTIFRAETERSELITTLTALDISSPP